MTGDSAEPGAVIERFIEAMGRKDYDAVDPLLADDVVSEYPQSGEVIRGKRNFRAVLENYPGGLPKDGVAHGSVRIVGSDEWAMTPALTLVRLTGSGSLRTAILKTRYPDGSEWWVVQLVEVRGGQISKATVYFAPVFEAPAWRAQWVERRS